MRNADQNAATYAGETVSELTDVVDGCQTMSSCHPLIIADQ